MNRSFFGAIAEVKYESSPIKAPGLHVDSIKYFLDKRLEKSNRL